MDLKPLNDAYEKAKQKEPEPSLFGYPMRFASFTDFYATVPAESAVHFSREDYNNFKKVITELKELKASLEGRSLETVIIQMSVLSEILEIADKVYLP